MPLGCPHCGAKVKDGKITKSVVYDCKVYEKDGKEVIGEVLNRIPDGEAVFSNMSDYYCLECETEFDQYANVPEGGNKDANDTP